MSNVRLSMDRGQGESSPDQPSVPDQRQWQREAIASDGASEEGALARLLRVIEDHASREQGAIASYQLLAQDFTDPVLAQILRLIAEDEMHHHRVLRQMASLVRANLGEWPSAPAPPPRSGLSRPDLEAAVVMVRTAMRDEHTGSRELRDLARGEQERYGGLLTLVFELMALDSRKHERMLGYVLRQLRAEQRAESRPPKYMKTMGEP
jgi:hypothetical protein